MNEIAEQREGWGDKTGRGREAAGRSGKASRFSREFWTHTGLKQASRRVGPWRGHLRTATHWVDGVVLDAGVKKKPSHGPIGASLPGTCENLGQGTCSVNTPQGLAPSHGCLLEKAARHPDQSKPCSAPCCTSPPRRLSSPQEAPPAPHVAPPQLLSTSA